MFHKPGTGKTAPMNARPDPAQLGGPLRPLDIAIVGQGIAGMSAAEICSRASEPI